MLWRETRLEIATIPKTALLMVAPFLAPNDSPNYVQFVLPLLCSQAATNFCGMRAMISFRRAMVEHHHSAYMSQEGRLYYTMGSLGLTGVWRNDVGSRCKIDSQHPWTWFVNVSWSYYLLFKHILSVYRHYIGIDTGLILSHTVSYHNCIGLYYQQQLCHSKPFVVQNDSAWTSVRLKPFLCQLSDLHHSSTVHFCISRVSGTTRHTSLPNIECILRNLDYRVDTPDARMTNDTDLLLQFLFEFVFGGWLGFKQVTCSYICNLSPAVYMLLN